MLFFKKMNYIISKTDFTPPHCKTLKINTLQKHFVVFIDKFIFLLFTNKDTKLVIFLYNKFSGGFFYLVNTG